MRTPFAVIAVLLVALLGLWFATDDGSDEAPQAAAPEAASVDVIARRVEALRGRQFETLPRPEEVTPEQAEREGLQDLDREYPRERRLADQEILKLLGLIEPEADLRELTASLFGEGVAGYYDPRSGRLRVVTGAATGTRVLTEIVLAHELTHALDDQVFGLDLDQQEGNDDAALARLALIEGTATALMYAYADEHFTAEEALGGVLGSAFAPTADLPPFVEAQSLFPYLGGERFVGDLLERAGGRWALVDSAYADRPPVTTEQVLHPERYIEAEPALPVRIDAGRVLGDGWERAAEGTWGELQTREMLARAGGGGSSDAAGGWGGDRYELWRARPIVGEDCPAPCRDADVLIMRWRWDTPRDADEFEVKLRAFADAELEGPYSVVRQDGVVTLAIAPGESLAERVAREA